MKKFFLLTIAAISTLGLSAQHKENDTLKIKWNGSKIWIFDDKASAKKDSIKKEQTHSNGKFIQWEGVDVGLCALSTSDNHFRYAPDKDSLQMNSYLDLNYNKSWYFSLNLFEKNIRLYKNYVKLGTGFGFEWNSYNFKKNITLNPNPPPNKPFATEAPDSIKFSKNKLKIAYIKIPLLLELNTNTKNGDKSFHIAGGIEFAYKINSKTKQKYEMNGRDYKIKQKEDYHLAPFKYSAVLRLGYGDYLTVFANYGLSQLFEKDKGPQVYPFSAGIACIF